MNRNQTAALLLVAILCGYWAYQLIASIVHDFPSQISYFDLGAIFLLGLFSGVLLGFGFGFTRKKPDAG
jgi:hypothetical protein